LFPYSSIIGLATLQLFFVKVLSELLYNHWFTFLLLGTVLYSIPRIGKHAGAGIISFVLVFYTSLPLTPAFVEWLSPYMKSIPIGTGLGPIESILKPVMDLALSIAFPLFFFQLLYIAILFAISAGLARFLGRRELSIPGL
jgi:hypothetical protein